MNLSEAAMLLAAGLFAGGSLTFAWSRVPVWRRMPLAQFREDFAQTLHRTDKVQPALLVAAAAAAGVFAASSDGAARALAIAGAAGLLLTLIGSVALLVPLQRRMIAAGPEDPELEPNRHRWFRGNLGRSIVATASFAMLAAAAAA